MADTPPPNAYSTPPKERPIGERLEISTLGGLAIRRGGAPVTGFHSRKVEALLVYVICSGHPASRDLLADLLWEDLPQQRAMANLRVVLHSLRRQLDPYVTITYEEVGLDPQADVWLDVAAFEASLDACQPEAAVDLYQGDFLAGFFLRGAPRFEDWAAVEQERLHQRAIDALRQLVVGFLATGHYQEGIPHARRLLALAPYLEEAHRQLMLLLAYTRQRRAALAQYETCRRALEEELGLDPAPETTALYEQIRAGGLRPPVVPAVPSSTAVHAPPKRLPATQLPAFLTSDEAPEERPPLFVAREQELARLDGMLEKALSRQGQVAFITGGPGRGKTTLMHAFARRALEAHSDLLVASGACNAYAGLGDPYLPFREVLAALTGDVEASPREQARRLWTALPLALDALMRHGPHLVEALISGPALLARVQKAVAGEGAAAWLADLRAYIARQGVQATTIEQSQLHEQFANTLRTLSQERPLLLLLDDLQWVDRSSAALLFHLGRRLPGTRILIVGSYRPEEVALAHLESVYGHPDRHPLEKVLAEFKRQFGDVWLDLRRADAATGRRFVDAYLDSEPNRLEAGFRAALFRHTEGHPLFTVELLRAMQERGDLLQDEEGRWAVGPALEWDRLPPRVEGVIEERVGRLEAPLRELLAVASVEGETFTAQVVAQIQGIPEREVLRALAQELERRHRLVHEQGELTIDRRHLSRYRFSHALFQSYLYQDLGTARRRRLHSEVATALEALYAGHTDEIAAPLAHHYAAAGDVARERAYARLAGERAGAVYANDEALRYLGRALTLTPEADREERLALLLAREGVYDRLGKREAQNRDLEALQVLAAGLDPLTQAQVALRRASYAEITSDYAAVLAATEEAVRLAQSGRDHETPASAALGIEAAGHYWWGRALFFQGEGNAARARLERALELARSTGMRQVEADSLRTLGIVAGYLERDGAREEAYYAQALATYREIGDRMGEVNALHNLNALSCNRGDFLAARPYAEQALSTSQAIGHRVAEALTLVGLFYPAILLGAFSEAQASLQEALTIWQEIGFRRQEVRALARLGLVGQAQGAYMQARAYYEQALNLSREIGHRAEEGNVLIWLGRLAQDLGDQAAATDHLERAVRIYTEPPYESEINGQFALLLLARHRNDQRAARDHAQQMTRLARDLGYRPDEATALTRQGDALVALEQFEEAEDAYRQALALRREMGQDHLAMEPLAGLARMALAHERPVQDFAPVDEILEFLEHGSLEGTEDPFEIYLTCYRVLQANQDPRARQVLDDAHRLLQERAAGIDDEGVRRSFLENVPSHRAIVEDWRPENQDRQS